MKILSFLCTLCIFSASLQAEPLDRNVLLEAIAQIEGGQWGQLGGRACMQRCAWQQHTILPYTASRFEAEAIPIYRQHLDWLIANLQRQHPQLTPAMIYLAWRRGLEGALRRLTSQAMPDACLRCQNVYEALLNKACFPISLP